MFEGFGAAEIPSSDAAVARLRQLKEHKGPLARDQEGFDQIPGPLAAKSYLHLRAAADQDLRPAPVSRDGILQRNRHLAQSQGIDEPGAGGGASLVGAGLERDEEFAAGEKPGRQGSQKIVGRSRLLPGYRSFAPGKHFISCHKSTHFGMGLSRAAMGFDRQQPPLPHHGAAYGRIGMGQSLIAPRFLQGKIHEKAVVKLHLLPFVCKHKAKSSKP